MSTQQIDRNTEAVRPLAVLILLAVGVISGLPAFAASPLDVPPPHVLLQADAEAEVQSLIARRDLEAAERMINTSLEAGASAWALSAKARVHVLYNEVDEAIRFADEALALDPNLQEAMATRARALAMRGDLEEAVRWADRALAVDQDNLWAMNAQAIALYVTGRIDEALALYERILDTDPDDLTALEGASASYFNGMGDPETALIYLDHAIALAATPAHYIWAQAQVHRGLGDNRAYLAALDEAIEASPSDPDYREEQATVLFTLRRFAAMNEAIDAALPVVDNVVPFLCLRGEALEVRGDMQGALAAYESAAESSPDDYYPHYRMAYVYRDHLEDYEACIAAWDRVIERVDSPADFHYRRGHAHAQFGRQREALNDFVQAVELDDSHILAWASIAERVETREAVDIYVRLTRMDPENSEWPGRMGYICELANDFERAIEWYSLCLERDPSRPHARRNRARCYQEVGRFAESIADETYQIENSENRNLVTRAYFDRGNVYISTEDYALAGADFQQSIRMGNRMPAAYNNLGWSYLQRSMWEEAVEAYDDAIRLFPEYAKAFGNRAFCLERLGEIERALESIEASMSLQRGPEGWEHAMHGRLLHRLGRSEAALISLGRATRIDPRGERAWESLVGVLLEQGQEQEADAAGQKFLEECDTAMAVCRLGSVYWAAGRDDRAEQTFALLLERSPQLGNRALTLYYLSRNQIDEAARHAEAVLRDEPDHVDAYIYNICVAMESADRDRVDALIRRGRAVEAYPEKSGHATLAVMAGADDPFEAIDRFGPSSEQAEAAAFIGYWLYLNGQEEEGLVLLDEAATYPVPFPLEGAFARRMLEQLDPTSD